MTLDERIARYLAKCPPAVSGQDGHGTTFKVACALVNGFALDADAAMRWMLVYNAGCMPPWKPRELRHKVEQAAKKPAAKPQGHLLGRIENRADQAVQKAPKLVPVRLTPRNREIRTVRTVFSEPYVKACAHMCVERIGKRPSVPSGNLEGLISVPGCQIGRPAEIEMADADWLAAEKSGLLGEPVVQAALWMFGPGCGVLGTGEEVLA